MARGIEIEWQLVPRDLDAVARWLGDACIPGAWTVGPSTTRRLADAYYDTADRRIARAGFALRLRRTGAVAEATLKALRRAEAGLARRREITSPLERASVPALRASRGAVGARLRGLVGSVRLRRLFALRTNRRVYAVRARGRAVAELALDRTDVLVGGKRVQSIRRVEIEVKAGRPAEVAAFVATLRHARHLTPAKRSKFEEGLRAVRRAGRPR